MVIGLKVCFTDTEGTADIADIADIADTEGQKAQQTLQTLPPRQKTFPSTAPPSAGPLGRHKKVRPHIGADF